MLFSLLSHLTVRACRLSGEALQGSERCFPLLHDPTYQVRTICKYRIYHRYNVLILNNTWPPLALIITIHISVSFYSTCEHCCNTSSLNLRNPSWSLRSFRGNDRKCVKGCFFRKLSTRTSIRVTADETAALWEPVMTVRQSKKVERESFVSECSLNCLMMPLFLTNLSFHSLFWDVDRCLCVKLQTSACLSFFSYDVSVK